MLILALETSFGTCSAAIGELEGNEMVLLAAATADSGAGHAEALFPMIERLVGEIRATSARTSFGLRDIGRIAVTRGPGTFTGVRTGIAAARGLALALGVPTMSASSLATIAIAARRSAGASMLGHDLVVAMPGGRGWLYVETFAAGGLASTGPRAIPAHDAAKLIGPAGAMLAGSGSAVLADAAQAIGRPIHARCDELRPGAIELLSLTPDMNIDLLPVAPHYLRPPDAKPQGDTSLPRAPA